MGLTYGAAVDITFVVGYSLDVDQGTSAALTASYLA